MAAKGFACCLLVITCLIAAVDLGLSIAEIAMGAIHLRNCPVQSKIPIYLVVAGCVGLVLALSNVVKAKKSKGASQRREVSKQSTAEKCASSLISLLSLFAFAWLICGTVWVFGVSPTFQHSNATESVTATTPPVMAELPERVTGNGTSPASTYCFQPLYKFAMATVLLRYAVVALYFLILLCTCCACCGAIIGAACCAKCLADRDDGAAAGERQEQAVNMMEKS